MPVFHESGMTFQFAAGSCFRFQGCADYQRIKGKSVTEMDFGWVIAAHEAIAMPLLRPRISLQWVSHSARRRRDV